MPLVSNFAILPTFKISEYPPNLNICSTIYVVHSVFSYTGRFHQLTSCSPRALAI